MSESKSCCRACRLLCLLGLFLAFYRADTSQQPPPGYSGQPPPRSYPPPPQAYPPEGQPEARNQDQPQWQGGRPDQYRQGQQQMPPRGGPPPPGYGGPGGLPPGSRGPPPPGYRPMQPPGAPRQPPGPPSYGNYPPSYYQRQGGPSYQQPPQEGGIFSRIANKFRGEPTPTQGYLPPQADRGYQPPPPPGQYRQPNTWQGQAGQQPGPGAMTPVGPVRGPMGSVQQSQGVRPPPTQPGGVYGHEGEGAGWTGGFKSLIGKVFTGENAQEGGTALSGRPSFRPKGAKLAKKVIHPPVSGVPGAYPGGPYMGYPGRGMMDEMPGTGETGLDLEVPGKPEIISVDGSIAFVLKSNELERKKRKFKMDGQGKFQVLACFEGGLVSFTLKDGSNSLKTTELLEQNQNVMLPDAAKKIRYLRSEFKRRLDSEGKNMSPMDKIKALEEHLQKVYGTAAMEGGIHMSSIGPALEISLDKTPLREGSNDLIGALTFRGIPLTVLCTGYGNVAMEVLRRGAPGTSGPNGALSPHLKIIGNYFQPDETMTIIGMVDTVPLIHEGNKSGKVIMEFMRGARWDTSGITTRSNAVLIGADLADLNLTSGFSGLEERITIGFLKMEDDFLDKFSEYAKAFDVVILGDGDLSFVNELLYEITEQ